MRKVFNLLFFLSVGYLGWGQVTLPHYEGFNYTSGQSLTTQVGWTLLNTSTSDLLITDGSLSYSSYSNPTGGKVSFSSSGEDAAKSFTQTTSGTIYVSFLINISSLGSISTTGGYFFGLNEGTSTTYGSTIWLRKSSTDATKFNIGINPRTTSANTGWYLTDLNVGTTYHVCFSYEIVSGSVNDIVKLWINPTTGGVEPTADITLTNSNPSTADLTNLNRILIRQDGSSATPSIDIDEIHIGTTWPNSVVMPVLLSSFMCQKSGKINSLTWVTASELNNSGFNIERSTNGTNFENIGFVKSLSSNGNSSSRLDYSFTDFNPIGLNQYYRLKQTDFDGKSKYSAIVMVTREAPTALTLTKVYPNPANSSIYINASVPTKMDLQFFIIDVAGRVVTRKNVFANVGNNGFDISVEHLENGTYFIKAISKEQGVVATEKFIKF